jgi:hypothetical protein
MLKIFFIILIVIGLLNLYWICGLFNTGNLINNDILSRSLFGNNFWTIFHAISLHHPWWTGNYPTTFINQPIPFYFWLIPLFAFLGFMLNKKNKYVG